MVPPKPPIGGVRRLLWLARALRLDGVFVWDHLQDFTPSALWDRDWSWTVGASRSPHELFDFQTLLGALAPAAGRLRLGVLVTEPIRRHPVVIAQALVTLAHLTARPPILGIGAGERENVEPYGLGFAAPVARLEEALAVIRLCLDQGGGPLDFAGRHFQLSRARFDLPIPPARKPEVWVGAHGPRMLRLTGRYGDGWYPVGLLTPGEYAARLAVIRGAAREAGRDPATIVPALQPHLVVAPSEREARAMLAAPPIRFAALLVPADLWRSVGHEHPLGAGFRGYVDFVPERYGRDELEAAMAAVPPELAEVAAIWGTSAQVVARLGEYVEAGARYLVPAPLSALVSRRGALASLRTVQLLARTFR
jgi:phthiodiolone/phenolphthiodiolone dimycocerosates ketoreductase